jgi:Na+/H+-dicarboxylate symporter
VPKQKWIIKEGFSDSNTNFLGLVFFSVILGVVLGRLGEKGKPLLDVFVSLSEATMVC